MTMRYHVDVLLYNFKIKDYCYTKEAHNKGLSRVKNICKTKTSKTFRNKIYICQNKIKMDS